eukprot:symbB.v1.2.019040.t1/scaffold1537.1/size118942/5
MQAGCLMYTFLMEALCNEMPNEVKTKAIVLLKTAILGIKAEKRYMYLSSCLPTLLKRCATCENPKDASQEAFVQRLEALKDLALIFPQASKELDIEDEEERARDGGGDLETSPLSLAMFVLLAEQVPQKMFPYILPLCISPLRRVNVLMRSCYVLFCNAEVLPNVVNLADLAGGLEDPQVMTPSATSVLPCSRCRWHPKLLFRKFLDSLTSTDDVEHKARGLLFRNCSVAMRGFRWPARCELYLELIKSSRVDAVIGSVVLEATLSGEVQIIDAMDTLAAALNICRLVALTKTQQAEFIRQALQPGKHLDLEAMLAKISKQIDAEMKLLEHGDGSALATALSEASVNLEQMKRHRISMVAHLVSRVREILSDRV